MLDLLQCHMLRISAQVATCLRLSRTQRNTMAGVPDDKRLFPFVVTIFSVVKGLAKCLTARSGETLTLRSDQASWTWPLQRP